jgi:hypothetical protein
MMYHCEADIISADSNSPIVTIAGNITKSLMAPDKGKALNGTLRTYRSYRIAQ